MAVQELYGNSAVISTTEYSLVNNSTTLANDTNAGVFQFFIDTINLTATDRYECKIYEKITSGGTKRVVTTAYLVLNSAEPIVVFPALVLMEGWDITLKRIAGADRTLLWSLRQLT